MFNEAWPSHSPVGAQTGRKEQKLTQYIINDPKQLISKLLLISNKYLVNALILYLHCWLSNLSIFHFSEL